LEACLFAIKIAVPYKVVQVLYGCGLHPREFCATSFRERNIMDNNNLGLKWKNDSELKFTKPLRRSSEAAVSDGGVHFPPAPLFCGYTP
jgi:hypothetical protein